MGLGMVLAMGGYCRAQAPSAAAPNAPTPAPAAREAANPFPAVNPKNFTAETPTQDEVNGFLKALWGYDQNREWQVAAIEKTPAPGVAKIVVLVADKRQPGRQMRSVFFTTPDGKHAIADSVVDFGAKPFAANRKILEERADGPAHGAKTDELLLVEFADLQCTQCQAAQDKMENLPQDFPQAKIVFEDVPQTGHPYSMEAALDGYCVRKTKGDAAFFSYARAVYGKQAGLTAQSANATLKAAITEAGADPTAVSACMTTPEAKAAVDAATKLASDLGVEQTPMLAVNGHMLPVDAIAYETLKQMIAYQAQQDGVTVHLQPTLTTLK